MNTLPISEKLISSQTLLKICIFSMLLFDVTFAVLEFFHHYGNLIIFHYFILSSLIYFILFSLKRETITRDYKKYAIVLVISTFLCSYIIFGRYLGFQGFIFLPIFVFGCCSFIYVVLRTRYNDIYQVILINLIYLVTRFGAMYILMIATSLMQ